MSTTDSKGNSGARSRTPRGDDASPPAWWAGAYSRIREDLRPIQEDVALMKRDLLGMKAEVTEIKTEVTEIKDTQATMEQRLTALENQKLKREMGRRWH